MKPRENGCTKGAFRVLFRNPGQDMSEVGEDVKGRQNALEQRPCRHKAIIHRAQGCEQPDNGWVGIGGAGFFESYSRTRRKNQN